MTPTVAGSPGDIGDSDDASVMDADAVAAALGVDVETGLNCAEVCPKGLEPSHAIEKIRLVMAKLSPDPVGLQRIGQTQRSSRRLSAPELIGPIDKADHLGGRINRQPMRCKTLSRRDVGRHLANAFKLLFVGPCQQGDDQVFQCDHAHLKLHQLGVGQRWRIGLRLVNAAAWPSP